MIEEVKQNKDEEEISKKKEENQVMEEDAQFAVLHTLTRAGVNL